MSVARIFAYGSNMHAGRMGARVPAARPRGAAVLEGRRLVLNKPGRDGSAKANLERAAGRRVWGVVWELPARDLAVLDRHEGGYVREAARVVHREGHTVDTEVYVASRVDGALQAFDGYLAYLVEGAREHGLPGDYVAFLASLRARAARSRRKSSPA